MKRVESIDVIRGMVMVIMALDHVRDLMHLPALTQDPTSLATPTAPIFLTRWITHLCAPTFVFLSGTSAYLSLQKRITSNRDAVTQGRELARPNAARPNQTGGSAARNFLLKRGLVLILLEITLINFAFWTDFQFRSLMLQVIFVIGAGLVLLSGVSKAPVRWLGVAGLVIIFLHDLLPLVPAFTNPAARLGWSLLFRTEVIPFGTRFMLLVAYPVIPWFGIMLFGYACGPIFVRPADERRKQLLRLSLVALGLFVVLRFINLYGDAVPWSVQKSSLFTVLSFVNVSKYPPSLLFTAVTLGIMFAGLWLADGANTGFTRIMTVYGKVPLFYYLIHWYLVKAAMIGMMLIQGYSLRDMPIGPLSFGRPPGAGVSLPVVYLVWFGLILLLYPLCRWYGRYKLEHPQITWLRYI